MFDDSPSRKRRGTPGIYVSIRNILGFIVALSLIAFIAYSIRPVHGRWMESFAEGYFWILWAIIAVSIGGAITRSGKAGAVVGFLAVWIPIFGLLILLLALGDIHARFAVRVATSFLLGASGALIGGSAGYLTGEMWPIKAKGSKGEDGT